MSNNEIYNLPSVEGTLEGIYGSGTSGRFKSVDVWFLEMLSCNAPDPVENCNALGTDPYTVHGSHEDRDVLRYVHFIPGACSWHEISPFTSPADEDDFIPALVKNEMASEPQDYESAPL